MYDMKDQMENVFNTKGRDRKDAIETGKTLIRTGDITKHKNLHLEIERYYDLLDDGSDAKKDLDTRFKKPALLKQNQLQEWNTLFKNADPYEKHDLLNTERLIKWNYECERFSHCENNYHYFKTYWDENNPDYEL